MQNKLFIDGQWIAPIEGNTLPVIDREPIGVAGRDHPVELSASDGIRGRWRRRWRPVAPWC
jgi:hypothetical protein